MSLRFDWSIFDHCNFDKSFLSAMINRTKKSSLITGDLIVDHLDLGSQSPNMDIKDIQEFDQDRFRGTVSFRYNGDAVLRLHTFAEIDGLAAYVAKCPAFAQPAPMLGACGLQLPVQITISHIDISCDILIAYQADKGVAVIVAENPLNSLKVSSSLDSIQAAKHVIHKQIHKSIQEALMEDIPPEISRNFETKNKAETVLLKSPDINVSIWKLASSLISVIKYLIDGIVYKSATAALRHAQLEYCSCSLSVDFVIGNDYLSRSMNFEQNTQSRPQTPKSEHRGPTHTMRLGSGSIFNSFENSPGSIDEPLTPLASPGQGPHMHPLSPEFETISQIKAQNRRLNVKKALNGRLS